MQNNPQDSTAINSKEALSADTLLSDMIASITRLHDVYRAETDALDASDTKRFVALQEDKLVAAKDYQSQAQNVLRHKRQMVDATPSLKQRIEELQGEFSEIAQQNHIALERMQRTTNRLGDAIRNAAKKTAQEKVAVNYGASGVMQSDDRKIISTGIIETA